MALLAAGRPCLLCPIPWVPGPYLTILGVQGSEVSRAVPAGRTLWGLANGSVRLAWSAQATSQSWPPVLVLGLPLHSLGAASRAGTGRGAADPLGNSLYFSF